MTVTFDEPVYGFEVGDLSIVGASASGFTGVDGEAQYTVSLVPNSNGTLLVTVDIPAGVAQDAAGNDNTAATQLAIEYDTTKPTVEISGSSFTAANPIAVTLTFSEAVTGFTADDISVTNGSVTNLTADADTDGKYTVDLVPAANGICTVDVAAGVATDAAGNANAAAQRFFTASYPRASVDSRLTLHSIGPGTTRLTQMVFGPDDRLYIARGPQPNKDNPTPILSYVFDGSGNLSDERRILTFDSPDLPASPTYLGAQPLGIAFHGQDMYYTTGVFSGTGKLWRVRDPRRTVSGNQRSGGYCA